MNIFKRDYIGNTATTNQLASWLGNNKIYALLGFIILVLGVALGFSLYRISALESELEFYDNLSPSYEDELDADIDDFEEVEDASGEELEFSTPDAEPDSEETDAEDL